MWLLFWFTATGFEPRMPQPRFYLKTGKIEFGKVWRLCRARAYPVDVEQDLGVPIVGFSAVAGGALIIDVQPFESSSGARLSAAVNTFHLCLQRELKRRPFTSFDFDKGPNYRTTMWGDIRISPFETDGSLNSIAAGYWLVYAFLAEAHKTCALPRRDHRIKLEVSPSGSTSAIEVTPSSACLSRKLEAAQFPSSPTSTTVRVSLPADELHPTP